MGNLSESKLWKMVRQNKRIYEMYSNSVGRYVRKIRLRPRVKAVQKDGVSVVFEIEKELSKTNAVYFVDTGTLLGFVRKGDVIKWDCDIDFGIYINDSFTWDDLEACMKNIGFNKIRQFRFEGNITEHTYQKGNISVDFFSHMDARNHTIFYSYYTIPNYEYSVKNEMHAFMYKTVRLTGTKTLNVKQGTVHIPNEAEAYLAGLYGDTWRIPNPNWVDGSGPDCHKVENRFGYCEKLVGE